ncbi:hypothetical protein [Candidatus Liberibacter brunswickensis]|uniref:hypothetical protein n=1 Tax=Candidatus Liberibacter brunswickensis TaxID=1968796 RepID=UPI002FE23F0D
MIKKSNQYVTRQEFNELNTKFESINKGIDIDEILYILNTAKGIGAFIKVFGGLATAGGTIIYFFQNIKIWLKG